MEVKGTLGERALFSFIRLFGRYMLGLYFWTVRIVNDRDSLAVFNRAPSPSGIFAFWHHSVFPAMWHQRRTHAALLISQAREGESAARMAASVGYHVVRGSPTRGGSGGMRKLLHLLRSGYHIVSITPDGSRGPRYSVKLGVLMLAQKAGRPITPSAIGLSRYWELNTWDRFRIVKPFSKGIHVFGEPMEVPPDADKARLAELAGELRARMIALQNEADRRAAAMRWW